MRQELKTVLREAVKQRLDEELEQLNDDQAVDEIMQSPLAMELLNDYPR